MTLTADDRAAIADLAARYCHATDARDPAALGALFATDGVLELPQHTARGRAEVEAGARTERPPMRHWTTNVVIEPDGDGARARCYILLTGAGREAPVIATGKYEDQLRREDGRWVFAHRRFVPDA